MKHPTDRKRKVLGRTSAPWSTVAFASRVRSAMKSGDEAAKTELSSHFFEQFYRAWKSNPPDATFFRDLALCIERHCHNLSAAEMWIARNLFQDSEDPQKQTHFFTLEEILLKFKAVGIPVKDINQLSRYLTKMGAIPKHSRKRQH